MTTEPTTPTIRPLRPHDRVLVFEDPVTRKSAEGHAEIVKVLSHDKELGLTDALVDFNDPDAGRFRRRVAWRDRILETGEQPERAASDG